MRILKIVLVILAAAALVFYISFRPARKTEWGVNFSIIQASYLGFDWKKMYLDILDDLKAKNLRVMAYWEIVEPGDGKYNFADFDYILKEAEKRNTKVILVLGFKQPRWPECHEPDWVKNQDATAKNQHLLEYIGQIVLRYKDSKVVTAWQLENEPFFPFGPNCHAVTKELYRKELHLVKSLDSRPIVVTDSGEKGAWLPSALAGGDIFGSTMYRNIYHDKKQKYIKYPIPPAIYRLKAGMVKSLSGIDKFIGVELQAEPWFATDVFSTSWERQNELMNREIFLQNVNYARAVGFAENYFWGVEWWYWAKNQGHQEVWEAAKKIINN